MDTAVYNNLKHLDIRCILFDLDNTLIETRKADSAACAKVRLFLTENTYNQIVYVLNLLGSISCSSILLDMGIINDILLLFYVIVS